MALNDYDQCARYVARQLDTEGFFNWLIGPRFAATWKWSQWLDSQTTPYPGGNDRRCDTVAAFDHRESTAPPIALVVEFMSRARRSTLQRVMHYTLEILRDCPYQRKPRIDYSVLGAIVNLTGRKHSNKYRVQPSNAGGLGFVARYRVRTLASESATELLKSVQSGATARAMLVWAPLMLGGDTAEYIAAWRAEVEREPSTMRRGDLVGLAIVFADRAKRRELWAKGVQGMGDVRSPVVLEWEQRGKAEGIAIGEERGKVEGEVHRARVTLIQGLQRRFQQPLPPSLMTAIETQSDLTRLEAWLMEAFTAVSLDAFLQAMK